MTSFCFSSLRGPASRARPESNLEINLQQSFEQTADGELNVDVDHAQVSYQSSNVTTHITSSIPKSVPGIKVQKCSCATKSLHHSTSAFHDMSIC